MKAIGTLARLSICAGLALATACGSGGSADPGGREPCTNPVPNPDGSTPTPEPCDLPLCADTLGDGPSPETTAAEGNAECVEEGTPAP